MSLNSFSAAFMTSSLSSNPHKNWSNKCIYKEVYVNITGSCASFSAASKKSGFKTANCCWNKSQILCVVTCTEAKTAAIQELLAGSNYSTGLATGSGTDQTIIVANSDSELYFEGAGKHSKMGELIGKTVTKAVKAAYLRLVSK